DLGCGTQQGLDEEHDQHSKDQEDNVPKEGETSPGLVLRGTVVFTPAFQAKPLYTSW
ncbi:MAG: hypothetical protein JWM16_1806, partial [Verrucomicrobiales bacterium]|nr:hypothetical protein [Verrucomicrobiales bacterium]